MTTTAEFKPVLPYLKNKAAGTVSIFLRKDERELYNEDARMVADELLMSDISIKTYQLDDQELTVLSLNKSQLNRVIRDLLLILRCRVELYEEIDEGTAFEVTAKGDLTNYEDFAYIVESCVELGELSTVMAIRIHGRDASEDNQVSIVLCNPHDMRITVGEFADTPNFYYLSECIQNTVPRECIIFKSDADARPEGFKNLLTCLNRSNLPHNEAQLSSNDADKIKEDFLSLLFKPSQGFIEPTFSKNILETAAPLFSRLHLLPEYTEKFLLVEYKSVGHLHLDSAAVRSLELFSLVQDDEEEPSRGFGTLYDHLNRCRSDAGRRLLRTWMRRPLSDMRRINERLDVVEALVDSHTVRSTLSDSLLRQVPDIGAIERRMLQRKANLHDCCRLYQLFGLLKRFDSALMDFYDEHAEEKSAAIKALFWDPVQDCIGDFHAFAKLIDEYIDLEYADESGTYRIKPDKNDALSDCWERMQKYEKNADTCLESAIKITGLDSIKLEKTDNGGFYFRAPMSAQRKISEAGKDYQIIDTNKSVGIKFTTTALSTVSNLNIEYHENYNNLQEELIGEVLQIAQAHASKLPKLSEVLSVIDVLVAFSVVAANSSNGYVRPCMEEKGTGIFELIECRHPIIEEKPDLQYIANDVKLHYTQQDGKFCGPRFAVVTGANMGGKSTYLRAAGLTVILAQMGCFVPCESARFSVFDGVHTRVGASDYQCDGVSTFMAEMVDVAAMLDAAKSTSLILVDELGRGTSTYDGFGMAWGVANHVLNKIGAFCLFATHYHEMSVLKEQYPDDVINLKVETHIDDDGNISLLYKIVEGLAERSFGINIARSVQFPEHIIKRAKRILNYLETNSWENADVVDPSIELTNEKISKVEDILSKLKALKESTLDGEELRRQILEIVPLNIC